jgi:hypothetical protein
MPANPANGHPKELSPKLGCRRDQKLASILRASPEISPEATAGIAGLRVRQAAREWQTVPPRRAGSSNRHLLRRPDDKAAPFPGMARAELMWVDAAE